MRKFFCYGLVFLAMTSFTMSCSSNDDSGAGEADNKEFPNSGGDGNTALEPDKQKEFVKETFDVLSSYIKADEFTEMTSVSKQFANVNTDALDNVLNEIMTEALTGTRVGTISYYDKYIMLSKLMGAYESKAGGRWNKISDTGDFTLKFTDDSGALWMLGAKATGVVAERVHIMTDDNSWNWYDYYSQKFYEGGDVSEFYADIPKNVNVTLTRNGVEKMKVDINIASYENKNGAKSVQSLMASCSGSATVSFTPAVETYKCHTTFEYSPNGTPNVNTRLSKGSTLLISASGMTEWNYNENKIENSSVKNVVAKVDILGRLQVYATLIDANKAEGKFDGFENLEDARKRAEDINNIMNAYITNNGGTVQQGRIRFITNLYDTYTYSYREGYHKVQRFELIPVLCFSDGSQYAFEEYFSESAFRDIIDYVQDFTLSIEKQLR